MRFPGTRLAPVAIAIWVVAAAGCRRAPLAGDAGQDAATTDAPTSVEARPETMVDSTLVHDAASEPPAADASADRSEIDAPADIAPVGDVSADMTSTDSPADTAPHDLTGADHSDLRPDEQPCGPTGLICAPYRCDVARGQCFTFCTTDDDCLNGRPCRSSSCGTHPAAVCSAHAECASGFCAQGVCCTSACNRLCSSCALPGQIGICAAVANGSLEPGGRCPADNVCNGRGECVPSVCAVDTDCGRYHRCTGARCVPCSATCLSTADCAPGATCIDQNGCTYCGFPDAGTGG